MIMEDFFNNQIENSKSIGPFKNEYRWLSNFAISPISVLGKEYRTVEHFYQASKTLIPEEVKSITTLESPFDVKKQGRKLTIREDWDHIKIPVMTIGTYSKYSQNTEFKQKLISTVGFKLIEFNTWHDNFWGQCTCSKCEKVKGQNNLGKILMEVRSELKREF